METIAKRIEIDPENLDGLRDLMDKYGDSTQMYFGESSEGEAVTISINPDHIVKETLQNNGWTRVNTYWYDGTQEETYRR